MKAIIVCEQSGHVRDALLAEGVDAVSCDILPTRSPGPHIQADVRTISLDKYDLMIAHPPCTYLTRAAKSWRLSHPKEEHDAVEFVKWLWNRPIGRIAIENPPGALPALWRSYDELVYPQWFGEPYYKQICLWLKNLPPLMATLVHPQRVLFTSNLGGQKDTMYLRSKTFLGVAEAMAKQWGHLE